MAIAGQLVAGQLFADDLVERPIGIERADDIVTVSIGERAVAVGAEVSVGIRVARCIQPVLAPALAVVRRGQQAINEMLVGIRIGVVDERGDLRGAWRNARQVKAQTADQGGAIGVRTEGQPLFFECLLDEAIDRRFARGPDCEPAEAAGLSPDANAQWSASGAARLTTAALGRFLAPCSIQRRNKAFSSVDSGFLGLRRHLVIRDQVPEQALIQIARNDHGAALPPPRE